METRKESRFLFGVMTALALALAASFAASCATSSGASYERSVAAEGDAAARAAEAKKKDKDEENTAATGGSAGGGWQTAGTWQSATSATITIQAAAPTGTVEIDGLPPGAVVFADDVPRAVAPSGFSPLRSASVRIILDAGYRSLRAELFGYEPWTAFVELPWRGTLRLEASMRPAAFSLNPASTAPIRFDPRRPGRMGTAAASFIASAAGTAHAWVEDSGRRRVRDLGAFTIDSATSTLRWDGKDDAGTIMPVGYYSLRVEGFAAGDAPAGTTSAAELTLEIAKLPPVRASSLHGGFSGALLAPDAAVLPPRSVQLSAGAYALIDSSTPDDAPGSMRARLPSWAGFRIGGLPLEGMELSGSFMYTPYLGYDMPYDPAGISAMFALKASVLGAGPISAALLVRGGFASFVAEESSGWPPSWDGPARFPGVGAGAVLEYAPGDTRAYASAELVASDFYPEWGAVSGPSWEVPGFFSWAYLRAGVDGLIDLGEAGKLSAGASAAVRTWPIGGPLGFQPPLSLAAELAWYPPSSPLVLHAYAAGQWEGFYAWYFAGGLGLSLLFF